MKLEFSEEQKFRIMDEIVKSPYSNLSVEECRYCLDYLQANSKMCSKYLINLRTLKKLFDYYLFCKSSGVFDASTFDIMGRGLLDLDNDGVDDADIICVRELEKRGDLGRVARQLEFTRLQGKSKSTYYRVCDRAGIDYSREED